MRRPALLAVLVLALAAACSDGAGSISGPPAPATPTRPGGRAAPPATVVEADVVPIVNPVEAPGLPLPGCPPPPPRPPAPAPGRAAVTPWKPPVLVPESALPAPVPPGVWASDLAPIQGKGMWLWKYFQSEAGDADAIVRRARDAGLSHLWVRVGDSRDGFYAAEVLEALVPRAHGAGLSVIGWGFPFLHDPVGDAGWSAEALRWRSRGGHTLDGFSPDIEMSTEGVALSAKRAEVYLSLVRQEAGPRLVVATVYQASDRLWPAGYPYAAIAPYVDAFAPMVYWGCIEPGAAAAKSIERLATLRPVHVIGQGYDMYADGRGRAGAPTAHETSRFLDVARRHGALGASFWVWHLMPDEQWDALDAYPWTPRSPTAGR
jgi:hypothetical protein